MLALLLQKQNKPKEALVHAKAALELWPNDESYQQLAEQLQEAASGVPK